MSEKKFKPMLAVAPKSLDDIVFPVIGSPKIDGIRAMVRGGKLLTRTAKPVKNDYVRNYLEALGDNLEGLEGLDGELTVGASFNATTSGIMSKKGTPNFFFHVFDDFTKALLPYKYRVDTYLERCRGLDIRVQPVVPILLSNLAELRAFENLCLSQGYEGIMIRDPMGPYKYGRSTAREGYLLKIKRFSDDEAVIISLEEQMENLNAKTTDAFGHSKRSMHQENKVVKNTLGAFVVRSDKFEKTFRIGTGEGLDDALRQKIWNNQEDFVGKIVKYKYQEHGTLTAPRIPIFIGFRDLDDI